MRDLDRLVWYAETHYAEVYAGLTVSDPVVIVYRVPSASTFDADISQRFGRLEVHFADAPHSRKTLQAMAEAISSDRGYWERLGIAINSVAVPPDGTRVEVGTADPERARVAVGDRYGHDMVAVIKNLGSVPLSQPG